MLVSFKYTALDCTGNRICGKLIACSKEEAFAQLKEQKLQVLRLHKSLNKYLQKLFGMKIKCVHLSIWSINMGRFLKAGMDLSKSLMLSSNAGNLKEITQIILNALKDGQTLFQAFNAHRQIFGNLLMGLLEVSNGTGELTKSFEFAGEHYQFLHQIKSKFICKIYYPLILLVMILCISIFFIIYLIPTFAQIIKATGKELPLVTKLMCCINAKILIISLIILLTMMIFTCWRWYDRLPIIKGMVNKFHTTICFSMLARLLKSGMHPIGALGICKGFSGKSYGKKLNLIQIDLTNGLSLSQAMKNNGFSQEIVAIVFAGQESNNLAKAAHQIESMSKVDLDKQLDKLSELVQPILMIIVGALFLLVLLGGILPLYQA